MKSIDMVSLLTIILVIVDDWYQAKGQQLMQDRAGMKPAFSDSEMLTLMLAHDFIPYPGETQYIARTCVPTACASSPNCLMSKLDLLLSKSSRRKITISIDYLGFERPDKFVFGYGLDLDELYGNLPFISVVRRAEG